MKYLTAMIIATVFCSVLIYEDSSIYAGTNDSDKGILWRLENDSQNVKINNKLFEVFARREGGGNGAGVTLIFIDARTKDQYVIPYENLLYFKFDSLGRLQEVKLKSDLENILSQS